MLETINIILIIFVVITAVAAVQVRELVSAVFLLGASSFFLAVLWTVLGAPDVAFTEAMVGVGASIIFMLFALFGSRHTVKASSFSHHRLFASVVVVLLGGLFLWGSMDLSWLGDAASPANAYLSPYYLKNCLKDALTPNAVTAVVVDYRSFDTLIESTVIFTAGVSCLVILRAQK